MPAPIEILNAYTAAKFNKEVAKTMSELGIDNTISHWASASPQAHTIVKGFLKLDKASAE